MRIKRLDFEGLCQVIRELCVLDPKERITAETQFERDLGISGDDGWLILDEAEKAFGIRFSPKSFQLRPKEALFRSEVENPFALIVGMIRREPEVEVRPFTVGELYQAILSEGAREIATVGLNFARGWPNCSQGWNAVPPRP